MTQAAYGQPVKPEMYDYTQLPLTGLVSPAYAVPVEASDAQPSMPLYGIPVLAPTSVAVASVAPRVTMGQLSSELLHRTLQELDVLKAQLLSNRPGQAEAINNAYAALINATFLHLTAIHNARETKHKNKSLNHLQQAFELAITQLGEVDTQAQLQLKTYLERKQVALQEYIRRSRGQTGDATVVISQQDPWFAYYAGITQASTQHVAEQQRLRNYYHTNTVSIINAFYMPSYYCYRPTFFDMYFGFYYPSLMWGGAAGSCGMGGARQAGSCFSGASKADGEGAAALVIGIIIAVLLVAAAVALAWAVKKTVDAFKHLVKGEKIVRSLVRIGGTMAATVGGVFIGMLAGAAIGSAIPVVGTLVGMVIGGILGGCFNAALFAAITKYGSQLISKWKSGYTNMERWVTSFGQDKHLADCGYDTVAIDNASKALYDAYQVSKDKKYKRMVHEIQEGKVMALTVNSQQFTFLKQSQTPAYVVPAAEVAIPSVASTAAVRFHQQEEKQKPVYADATTYAAPVLH